MNRYRFFKLLTTVILTIIATMTGLISFISVQDRRFVYYFTGSAYYLIPWILISIIVLIYPFFVSMTLRKYFSYILTHYPFILLLVAVTISFITQREYTINIQSGETVSINEIRNKLGLINHNSYTMTLDRVDVIPYKSKRASKIVRSILLYNEGGSNNQGGSDIQTSEQKIVEVNRPLKIKDVKFYQMGYNTGLIKTTVQIDGNTYEFKDRLEIELGKYSLTITPARVDDTGIIYYTWSINLEDEFMGEGEFNKFASDIGVAGLELNVEFLNEKIGYSSTIKATHKPFNLILAISAIFFLICIPIDFLLQSLFFKKRADIE